MELDSHFKSVMDAGGSGERLVQTFTPQAVSHSCISDPTYPALAAAVLRWAVGGPEPMPQSVADDCRVFEARFGPGCSFAPAYVPAALSSRAPAALSGGHQSSAAGLANRTTVTPARAWRTEGMTSTQLSCGVTTGSPRPGPSWWPMTVPALANTSSPW